MLPCGLLGGYSAMKTLFSKCYLIRLLKILVCFYLAVKMVLFKMGVISLAMAWML